MRIVTIRNEFSWEKPLLHLPKVICSKYAQQIRKNNRAISRDFLQWTFDMLRVYIE